MTVLSGTTLTGVAEEHGSPGQPILKSDVEAVAKDHGRIFEGLTGKKSDDSGGASVVTVHSHIETGNRLYWPICTQHYGCGLGNNDAATLDASSQFQDMPYVFSSGATHETINAWYWPVWIPPAWVGLELVFGLDVVNAAGFVPMLTVSLETWGTSSGTGLSADQRAYTVATDVSGMRDVALVDVQTTRVISFSGDPALLTAVLTPATSGLHAVRVSMTLGNGAIPFCGFSGLHLVPLTAVNNSDLLPAKGPVGSSNIIVVGDADGTPANDYMPADSSLYAFDDPMGMGVTINNLNSAWCEEMATGLPVSGNATATLSKGHDHSNPGSAPWYGTGIEFCLLSLPLGTISTNAALGGRFKAPKCQAAATTFAKVHRMQFYTPVFAGTQKLYCAAMVYKSAAKGQRIEVKFTTTPAGAGATSVTLQCGNNVGDPAGYQLLTDVTNSLTFKSGGLTVLEVEMRENTNLGNTDSLLGFALWLDY